MTEELVEKACEGLADLERLFHAEGKTLLTYDDCLSLARAAIASIQEDYAIVPRIPTPKICEAGLFANDNALLLSASGGDMFEAYRSMISAAERTSHE